MNTAPQLIPLLVVTGFLGSGKTTVIKNLLEQPGLAGTLVIVNEFGEVGIDHVLLEASSDDTILLANGCLCCTIRGNLVDTLLDVLSQREQGRIGAFDRVVVETSGVADPAPLLAFLLGEPQVMARYRLDALVTTCDLVNGAETLARQPEAVSQIRLADRILLTKRDLVGPERLAEMMRRVRELNPVAEIMAVEHGRAEPDLVLSPAGRSPAVEVDVAPCFAAEHEGCDDHGHTHAADHTDRFGCAILHAGRALARNEIEDLLAALRKRAGASLLRVKGFLPVDFDRRLLVLQGALTVVHDLHWLDLPASNTGLVLITEGGAPAELLCDLAAFGLRPKD